MEGECVGKSSWLSNRGAGSRPVVLDGGRVSTVTRWQLQVGLHWWATHLVMGGEPVGPPGCSCGRGQVVLDAPAGPSSRGQAREPPAVAGAPSL